METTAGTSVASSGLLSQTGPIYSQNKILV